jgi:hypothetical protein
MMQFMTIINRHNQGLLLEMLFSCGSEPPKAAKRRALTFWFNLTISAVDNNKQLFNLFNIDAITNSISLASITVEE